MENTIETNTEKFTPTARQALYLTLSNPKSARNLTKYGELVYTSQKQKYAVLYVNADALDTVIVKLNKLPFVKTVTRGELNHLAADFGDAFVETNQLINKELSSD